MIYDLYTLIAYMQMSHPYLVYTYTPGTRVRFDVHRSGGITRDVTRDFSSDLDQQFRAYPMARARDRNKLARVDENFTFPHFRAERE